ncbi:hypothetical protein CRD59_05495 [Bifidobacterium xylocopae]|uniref:Uncharacterized protein n=1 Tax=Bifidobacterium xylocopae TaxID=2493119 RepID=A0A366KDB8_9BIFI|nr:hypothetical protein CRD59_05495 [Bifidobacterium xylocopae]
MSFPLGNQTSTIVKAKAMPSAAQARSIHLEQVADCVAIDGCRPAAWCESAAPTAALTADT